MALHNKLKDLLLKAGMNEAEILVYVELLKKPAVNVWELVVRTNLSKSSVYRAVENLLAQKIIEKNIDGLKALSLKSFVAGLNNSRRALANVVYQLKQIGPFLHAPGEAIEEFETLYTPDQVAQAFIFMSEIDYNVNHDFGDFESFLPKIGGPPVGHKFRMNRAKKAQNYSICTSSGPLTDFFTKPDDLEKFNCKVDFFNLNYKNRFIVFSDISDYVLFTQVDGDNVYATQVKSKMIADVQRMQFDYFSQQLGNR